MDVILEDLLVNHFLGIVYGIAFFCILRILYFVYTSKDGEWALLMSRKHYLLWFFWAVLITCLTVSYQNFFNDFSEYLLWWRLSLISIISFVCFRWGAFASKARKMKRKVRLTVMAIVKEHGSI